MARLIVVLTWFLLVGGCSNVAYYAQAVEGHLRLMAATRPLSDVIGDLATDPVLRRQLEHASVLRDFASRELALPDNGSYRAYADLGRPYVAWNVFAAPEFSLELQQWCMIFIGCVNYRGYFAQSGAGRHADELSAAGADTQVSGVPAYTTLGLFNDPLLNTFVRHGDQEVARIVFHELAHQLIYVKGDTAFNESFATSVEIEGVRRWLSASATPQALRDLEQRAQRALQFHRLLADCRDALRVVYASALPPAAMRAAKAEAIARMRAAYADLKADWGGYGGYDPWFSQSLNNATLGSVGLYTQWVPAFQALLAQEDGSLPRFYLRVAALADFPQNQRTVALDLLLSSRTETAALVHSGY